MNTNNVITLSFQLCRRKWRSRSVLTDHIVRGDGVIALKQQEENKLNVGRPVGNT